jgi:FtsZ-binding cell division protein ZapB
MVESENCRLRNALYDAAASLLIIRQQAERIEDSDDASEIRHLASSSHQSALEAIESPCEVFAQRIAQLERDNAALRHTEENLAATVRGLEFELEKAEKTAALLRGTVEALGDANDRLTIEISGLRKDKERLDWLNTHCMSADPIMGRSTYRWTIEHDEPDIRAAIRKAMA